MKRAVSLAIISGLAITLSACASAAAKEPLLLVGASGGHCVEGLCEEVFTIYTDGTTSDPEIKLDQNSISAAVDDSSLRTLKEDNNPQCQSFVDGQDLTIAVPAWGETVYTPCLLSEADQDPLVALAQDALYRFKREIF